MVSMQVIRFEMQTEAVSENSAPKSIIRNKRDAAIAGKRW